MTQFVDGPAGGVTLWLRRAPLFLRAVCDVQTHEWDALDQIDDSPKPHETVVVYALDGMPSYVHINAGRGRCGVYRGGIYKVVAPQPPDDVLRDVFKWRAWALEAAKETRQT